MGGGEQGVGGGGRKGTLAQSLIILIAMTINNEGGNAIYVEDGDDNDASPQTIFPLRPRIKLLIF